MFSVSAVISGRRELFIRLTWVGACENVCEKNKPETLKNKIKNRFVKNLLIDMLFIDDCIKFLKGNYYFTNSSKSLPKVIFRSLDFPG
ncbi:transposase [Chryseobacterium sp. StRB126]|nr:transposase [Chryseobacterium sp. StRB126]